MQVIVQKIFKNKVLVLVVSFTAFFFYIFLNNNKLEHSSAQIQKKYNTLQTQNSTKHTHEHHEPIAVDNKALSQNIAGSRSLASKLKKNPDQPEFSYTNEIKRVEKIKAAFPISKPELISIITKPDPFKVKGHEAKPHTTHEITQRKMGAVKVLALKVLLELEKNKNTLLNDLLKISQEAADKTISNIALAASESIKKNRSLMKDFSDGTARLPLPQK